MRASKLDKKDETQKNDNENRLFLRKKWAREREPYAIQKCCLRIQKPQLSKLAQSNYRDLNQVGQLQPCGCSSLSAHVSCVILPFILAEQIIIMVNREIKGTMAKLKEKLFPSVLSQQMVLSICLASLVRFCRHKSLCSHRRPVRNHLVTISHEGKNDHSPTGCV